MLQDKGINSVRIVPEENDVALSERVRRVNVLSKEAILILIRCNAIGKVPDRYLQRMDHICWLQCFNAMYNEYYGRRYH